MLPHERSLVKRLAGRPFALLGINTDADREALKPVLEKKQITWRSWWDGSIEGPICTEWQIANWPTLYVLDEQGIIRHVDAGGPDADVEAVGVVVDGLLEKLKGTEP
jgi:hypothetical protein